MNNSTLYTILGEFEKRITELESAPLPTTPPPCRFRQYEYMTEWGIGDAAINERAAAGWEVVQITHRALPRQTQIKKGVAIETGGVMDVTFRRHKPTPQTPTHQGREAELWAQAIQGIPDTDDDHTDTTDVPAVPTPQPEPVNQHGGYHHGYCKGCGYKRSIRDGYCDNCRPTPPAEDAS